MAVFQRSAAAGKSFCLTFPRNPLSYNPFQVRGRTRWSSPPRVHKNTQKHPHPLIFPGGKHTRICQGLGPKHLDAFCLKGSWGQLSKSAILASKLPTPGPKPLLWSVLELGHLIKIAFLPKTSLACVVFEANASPQFTCLQCPNCVSIQNGHFYFSRLKSALALEFPTRVEKTSRCV